MKSGKMHTGLIGTEYSSLPGSSEYIQTFRQPLAKSKLPFLFFNYNNFAYL